MSQSAGAESQSQVSPTDANGKDARRDDEGGTTASVQGLGLYRQQDAVAGAAAVHTGESDCTVRDLDAR